MTWTRPGSATRSLAVASGRASAAELHARANAVLPDLTGTAGVTALIVRLTEPPLR